MTPSSEQKRLEAEALALADRAAVEQDRDRKVELTQEALRTWQALRRLKRAHAAA